MMYLNQFWHKVEQNNLVKDNDGTFGHIFVSHDVSNEDNICLSIPTFIQMKFEILIMLNSKDLNTSNIYLDSNTK